MEDFNEIFAATSTLKVIKNRQKKFKARNEVVWSETHVFIVGWTKVSNLNNGEYPSHPHEPTKNFQPARAWKHLHNVVLHL